MACSIWRFLMINRQLIALLIHHNWSFLSHLLKWRKLNPTLKHTWVKEVLQEAMALGHRERSNWTQQGTRVKLVWTKMLAIQGSTVYLCSTSKKVWPVKKWLLSFRRSQISSRTTTKTWRSSSKTSKCRRSTPRGYSSSNKGHTLESQRTSKSSRISWMKGTVEIVPPKR